MEVEIFLYFIINDTGFIPFVRSHGGNVLFSAKSLKAIYQVVILVLKV